MEEIPKFTTKRKNGIENKRYYINIRSVNPDDNDNDSNSNNNIGFRESLYMVKRKSETKCKIDDNFAGLMDTVKKIKMAF